MHIPNPCYENWSEMTPVQQGRYCMQCNKVVIDMTRMSKKEMATLLRSEKVHCGVFYEDQMETPVVMNGWLARHLGKLRKEWIIATLLVMLQVITPAHIYAEVPRTESVHREPAFSPVDSGVSLPGYIQGRLSVKNKKNPPVINKTVYVYTASGKLITTINTDDHGFFAFALPDSAKNESVRLVVKKHTSRKGRFVRYWGGAKQWTNDGSWTEMQIQYKRRKKLFRPKIVGCPTFR